MKTIALVLFSLLLTAAACKKESAGEAGDVPPAAAEKSAHAPADVVPGSHEDWCAEHAVPESQCTRCNPDLIAAFKATGDWCEEHGVPDSQCLKCNPDLAIVRPPKKP
jgi:hypothetical protein